MGSNVRAGSSPAPGTRFGEIRTFFILLGSNIGRRNYSLEHSIDQTTLITNTKLFDFLNTSYISCYKFPDSCNLFLKNHSQPSIRRWEHKASRFLHSLYDQKLIFPFQKQIQDSLDILFSIWKSESNS